MHHPRKSFDRLSTIAYKKRRILYCGIRIVQKRRNRSMRFYILSDLHIGNTVQANDACEILKKLCCEIRKNTVPDETVLFIVLGDIANKGEAKSFEIAENCLKLIKQELKDFNVRFEFVPGNHDLDKENNNLVLFDNLISKFGSNYTYAKRSVFSKVYENVNFIFADSTLSRDHRAPGKLDIDSIKQEIKINMSNVLFCHHALTQELGGGHDIVENSAEVYERLNQLSIAFYFHGHVHRTNATIPANGLVEIGCGSLSADISWDNSLFHQFSVGCIQDGSIIYVERWVDTSDGSGLFAENQIYPQKRTFADPDMVLKQKYEPVSDYISRVVLPYEVASLDSISRFLSNNKEMSLNDVVEKHAKVLLLSDAGMGKSIELQNVAYSMQTKWHTFLFSLKNYTEQSVYELLPTGYKSLSPSRYMLLFDGYDELNNDCREEFEKKVRIFAEENPGVRIVISSRANFCRLNDENQYNKLPEYKVFVLDKLKTEAITKFLGDKYIDKTKFYDVSQFKKVFDLLSNPFYLTRLAEIFLIDNDLPPKTELMEKLIEMSFSVDNKKFPGNLEDHYQSLFAQLEKVAFAMQLMNQTDFDDREEYQRLFDYESRELVKKSGLLNQSGNVWTFIHNNFREYLAARFLSKLPQTDAISIFSDGKNVKPSWVNTIGYLIGFNLTWDLFGWLTLHSPSALVKFEPDRLPEDKRIDVFKRIFTKYEETSLYFYDEYCDERELANFANSIEVINFLIEKINKSSNVPSQYNAINILRHFHSLFGLNEKVKDCLISCCKCYPETPKQICRLCLLALGELKLYDSELTSFFMDLFGASDEDYIRLGMYEYLISSGETDLHVEYFLSGIKYIEYSISNEDVRIGNERTELIESLKQMSTVDSIKAMLKFFAEERHFHFYDSEKVISATINAAICLFKEGNSELYSVALECYEVATKKWSQIMTKALADFFVKTDTLHLAIAFLAELFAREPQHISDLIYEDENSIEYLKEAYLKNKIKSSTFVENVVWYVRDANKYRVYAEIIRSKDSIDIPEYKEPINYDVLRFNGMQEFFDALFDINSRTTLLCQMLNSIDGNDVLVGEILESDKKVEAYSAQWYLQSAIYRYAAPNTRVADFFNIYDVEAFIIHVFSDYLEKESKLILSAYQKQFLEDAINKMIGQGIFVDAIKYHQGGYNLKAHVPEVLDIILHFQMHVDEDALLSLTEVPAFHFDRDKNSFKFEFLESQLGKDKLKSRLLDNVKNDRVKDMVLEDHIDFFYLHNDDALVETALGVCRNTSEYSSLRASAWKYLWSVLGVEYISKEIIPYANGEFLVEINGKCKDIDKKVMCEAMEKQYRMMPDIHLLSHMITLGSKLALKQYLKQVKERKKPPENCGINVDGPTAAIETVKNPEYISILNKLFKLTLKKDFVDLKFRGLQSTLIRAFINCGPDTYNKTIKMIKKLAKKNFKNKDNFHYCNYVISEIESAQRTSIDTPMTVDEVKNLFKKCN